MIRRLNSAAMEALTDPTVRQRLQNIGMDIYPPSDQSPEWLRSRVKADIEKWWPIIKAANIKPE